MLALDIFGIGKIADAVQTGEWIAAIFAGLAWAFGHPSTAAWVVGFVLIVAVLRRGWPFTNVPEIGTFLGKAIASTGLVLILGGFGWRAADEILTPKSAQPTKQSQSSPAIPIQPQRDIPSQRAPVSG